MPTKKEDRRVKFTKIFLKNSLIDILCEKDISKITIKEICERADINRATFYAHFSDQYALLECIKEEYIDNIIKQVPINELEVSDSLQAIINILNYIVENMKLSKLLLSERGDVNFQKRIMRIVYDDLHMKLMSSMNLSESSVTFISSYVITGSVGVIQNWFENGLKQSPEEVAKIISELAILSMEFTGR